MKVIKVPKTPKSAFNPKRRASALLKSQIKHLEWAVRPAAERKPGKLRVRNVRTEEEAAARIERLTRQLYVQEGREPPGPPSSAESATPRPGSDPRTVRGSDPTRPRRRKVR